MQTQVQNKRGRCKKAKLKMRQNIKYSNIESECKRVGVEIDEGVRERERERERVREIERERDRERERQTDRQTERENV